MIAWRSSRQMPQAAAGRVVIASRRPRASRSPTSSKTSPIGFVPILGSSSERPIGCPSISTPSRRWSAPRALFSTESKDDLWANPQGTQLTFLAAREVYQFLGAGDKIGLHYRQGKHNQNAEDFTALLEFADHVLNGKSSKMNFVQLPYQDAPKAFDWAAQR